ncbi:hypothetical protein C3L33_11329, partial [Rhododendron williamsianum]
MEAFYFDELVRTAKRQQLESKALQIDSTIVKFYCAVVVVGVLEVEFLVESISNHIKSEPDSPNSPRSSELEEEAVHGCDTPISGPSIPDVKVVRSATLDTWLLEHVAFIHYESHLCLTRLLLTLPTCAAVAGTYSSLHDTHFIVVDGVPPPFSSALESDPNSSDWHWRWPPPPRISSDKRWVPKDNNTKSPARPLEDEASVQRRIPGDRSGHHHAAAEGSVADKTGSTELDAKKTHSSSGIEDLFQDSPSVVSAVSEKPQKDAKTDMSLFDNSNMVSSFAIHQQQIAMLHQQQSLLMLFTNRLQQIAMLHQQQSLFMLFTNRLQQIAMLHQQQSLLMAAAAKSGDVMTNLVGNAQSQVANGTTLPTSNWPNVGFQFTGMMTPAAWK